MPRKKKSDFQGTTHITVVLDRSGSMISMWQEVVTGYNAYVTEQAKLPGVALLTLVVFDTAIDTVQTGVPISETGSLDETKVYPRGCTALFDALGRAVHETEGRVGEADRAVVMVITDGQENSSREVTKASVQATISRLEAKQNWTFTYMSASPTGFADAANIGIQAGNVAAFAPTPDGAQRAFHQVSASTTNLRGTMSKTSGNFYAPRDQDKTSGN